MGNEGGDRLADALVPPSSLRFIQGGARSREVAEAAVAYVIDKGADESPMGGAILYSPASLVFAPAISNPPLLRDFMAFEQHLLF